MSDFDSVRSGMDVDDQPQGLTRVRTHGLGPEEDGFGGWDGRVLAVVCGEFEAGVTGKARCILFKRTISGVLLAMSRAGTDRKKNPVQSLYIPATLNFIPLDKRVT